jgi:ketosteroid isomerase-like protein
MKEGRTRTAPPPAHGESRPGGGASTPEESLLAFAAALRRGELDRAAACFASDACFLTPDATIIRGRAEIAEILSQLRATGVRIEVEIRAAALRAGETALTAERWTVRAGPADAALTRSFDSRTVLRRFGSDWRVLFVAPWGWR